MLRRPKSSNPDWHTDGEAGTREQWRQRAYEAEVRATSVAQELDQLLHALHRMNVDWVKLARSCGDQKCHGDCRYVEDVRVALARRR